MDIDRALGRAWRDDRPWRVLTRLTELDDRLGGHPGERRAAEIVATTLRDAGVRNVTEHAFEMRRWTRGSTSLGVRTTRGGRDVERTFEAVALPYAPPCDLQGELVDVGYGTPAEIDGGDVAGNVVLASTETPPDFGRFYHRVEKVGHAATAGAAAFVFANHVPGQLPPTGALQFDRAAAIPGVGVSKETGDWLREYADGDATAVLQVDARTEDGTSHNVVGELGPETDESVLVLAHHDAHDVAEGALDNGCGVATLVGAVGVLAAVEADLDTRVRVATVGCEELGLTGSEALAADPDLGVDPDVVVNVDGAGRDRTLKALTHGSAPLADLAREVTDRVDHPLVVDDLPHPYSDHWPFLREGTPALQLHSQAPGDDGPWERGWTHTRADTRDKADPRTIREHAMLTALLVLELADDDTTVPRHDRETLRDRLVEAGTKPGMEAAGIWPDGW